MLLSYKPLHLEAQQRLQEEGCVVDITLCVFGPLTDSDGGVLRRCWRTPGRWPSFKEGQNVLDFGANQLAGGGDWRWCKEAVDGGHPCR